MTFSVLVTSSHWLPQAQQQVRDAGGVIHFMHEPVDEQSLIQRLTTMPVDAVVLRGSAPFTTRVLAAAPLLRIIAKNGAGVDSVDIEDATRRGIAVMVAAGANSDAVAEHALALMLGLVRNLKSLDLQVHSGAWAGATYQGRDFRGSTVGIVGLGSIGHRTALMAQALGARVIVLRRAQSVGACEFETETDLDRLLGQVDILSLHCPLTAQTRGLIGQRELALMKPGALLVNTARGPIVDEPALIDALRAGRLGGAGLDTFDTEPMPADHPLLGLPQVLATPHVAGVTRLAVEQVARITAANIVGWLTGQPFEKQHLINPAVLDQPGR